MPTVRGNGPRPPEGISRLLRPLKPLYERLPLALRRHRLYRRNFGVWGNFRNPSNYNEKLQWRIINDRRTWLGVTSDKLASKEYARRVAESTGLPIKVPETYWVGTDVRELRALSSQLPDRWVFKPNHSCGRYRLYDTSDEPVDWEELIAIGDLWLKPDEEETSLGHFGYSLARKLLIVEQRIGDVGSDPATCRSHGSNGQVVDHWGTIGSHPNKVAFLCDAEFEPLDPFVLWAASPDDIRSPHQRLGTEERRQLNEMVVALTSGFDFLRVNYYLDRGFWFAEYSPYSSSGLIDFGPQIDRIWSEAWTLPNVAAPDPRESLWRELLDRRERGTMQV